MDTLVALSTGVAYVFSVFNTLYPEFWHQRGMHAHVYFESSAVVITFILLGKLLEEKAKGNTSFAIKKLMGLQAKTVILMKPDNTEIEIPISEVKVGDELLLKPGAKIAVDGKVLSGDSYVDESMISGEPIPLEKSKGSSVLAGTINQKGSLRYVAEKVGSETLLSQIIQAVKDAQGSKAPVQKMVDKIAAVFVPVVIGIALFTLLMWIIFGGAHGFTQGLLAMVTVLVIACPCALGLATPTAIMVGVGKAAEQGILIKDAESLERAKKINAIVLDKTGTITEGHPKVNAINWFVEEDPSWNNILYSIEKSSEHPLADAIAQYLQSSAQYLQEIKVRARVGKGIEAHIGQEKYYVGNIHFMEEMKIESSTHAKYWVREELDKAHTVVLFADDKNVLAAISISDQIKEKSKAAIQELKEKGIDVYMLTGDNAQTAKHVAMEVGIRYYKANMLPADKSAFIIDLQKQGKVVAMVGDGINDSNALAQADVSIAMGKGSDIAMDVAKTTIISSDLSKIYTLIHLSKRSVRTIHQNLFWAFIYNLIGIPIAAGVLYPFNGFLLDPMIAGAAMALSSVSVVLNSLRLKSNLSH